MTPTPSPTDHVDNLMKAGVGSANLLLVIVIYMVSQLYSLTNEVAELSRDQAVLASRVTALETHASRGGAP